MVAQPLPCQSIYRTTEPGTILMMPGFFVPLFIISLSHISTLFYVKF